MQTIAMTHKPLLHDLVIGLLVFVDWRVCLVVFFHFCDNPCSSLISCISSSYSVWCEKWIKLPVHLHDIPRISYLHNTHPRTLYDYTHQVLQLFLVAPGVSSFYSIPSFFLFSLFLDFVLLSWGELLSSWFRLFLSCCWLELCTAGNYVGSECKGVVLLHSPAW